MSNTATKIQARILEKVSVLHSDNPEIVVLRMQTKGGEAIDYAIRRPMLTQLSEHLVKHS